MKRSTFVSPYRLVIVAPTDSIPTGTTIPLSVRRIPMEMHHDPARRQSAPRNPDVHPSPVVSYPVYPRTVRWSVNGVGSIDRWGRYRSGHTTGSAIITAATLDGHTASTTIAITSAINGEGDGPGPTEYLVNDRMAYADTTAFQAAITDPTQFDRADVTARFENVIIDESVQINGHHSMSIHATESVRMLYPQFRQAQATPAVWMKWSQVIPVTFLTAWEAATTDPYTTNVTSPESSMVIAFSDDSDVSSHVTVGHGITGGATPVVHMYIHASTNWGDDIPGVIIHSTLPLANFRDGLQHDFATLIETKYIPASYASSLRIRVFHRGPGDTTWTLMSELVNTATGFEPGPISTWPCFGWQVALGDADGNDIIDDLFISGSVTNFGDLQVVDALRFPDPFSIGASPDPTSSGSDPVTFTLEPIVITMNGEAQDIVFATAVNAAGQDVSTAPFIINTQFVVADPVIASVSARSTNETGGGIVTSIVPIANGTVTVAVRIRPSQDPGNSPEIFYGPSVPLVITISGQPG